MRPPREFRHTPHTFPGPIWGSTEEANATATMRPPHSRFQGTAPDLWGEGGGGRGAGGGGGGPLPPVCMLLCIRGRFHSTGEGHSSVLAAVGVNERWRSGLVDVVVAVVVFVRRRLRIAPRHAGWRPWTRLGSSASAGTWPTRRTP
eukprot:4926956-Pyramimonas_sp.AAC.1